MKNIERKFVGTPTSYASPRMRVIVMAMQKHILQVSGSDIHGAEGEEQDIFGE